MSLYDDFLRATREQDNFNVVTYYNTALCEAARQGHLPGLESLLQIPAVAEQVTAMNNAVLCEAARQGHLPVLERLLQIPAAVAKLITGEDNRALRGAARQGHLPVLERLLQIPAVMQDVTAYNNIVLREAAYKGHLAVVERLLLLPSVRKHNSFTKLSEEFPIIKETRERIMNERKGALLWVHSWYKKNGSHAVLPEDILYQVLSRIKSLRVSVPTKQTPKGELWHLIIEGKEQDEKAGDSTQSPENRPRLL